MSKTTNINIRVPANIKQELIEMAEASKKDLSSFLLEEIFLHLRGYFIKCPSCGKPCFDERTIHLTGPATIVCQFCKHEFNYDFD